MPRTSRRRVYIRRAPRPKYSMVTFARAITLDQTTTDLKWNYFVICPSSDAIGMRKCKNFYIEFTTSSAVPIGWALGYLPQGAQATSFLPTIGATSGAPAENPTFVEMFANSQWIIGNGTIISGSVNKYRTRLARNLNNGDQVIMFIFTTDNTDTPQIYVSGNYALKYN